MKILSKLILFLFFLLNFNFAFGWGKTGHRIVAEIAYRHLTENSKKQIAEIIGNQPLAYWANYPDFIKSDPAAYEKTSSWHYLNFPENLDRNQFDDFLNQSTDKNIYKRTQVLIDRLKNRKKYSKQEQTEILYFLVHLIGDAHQPLHLGREEDLGGNTIKVRWFDRETNLHSLWDDELVDFQKYSYTEYSDVLDFHDSDANKILSEGNLEDWYFDSYLQSAKIYSGVKNGDELKYRYDYEHVELMESQLLKAGLRLAKLLNEIFD